MPHGGILAGELQRRSSVTQAWRRPCDYIGVWGTGDKEDDHAIRNPRSDRDRGRRRGVDALQRPPRRQGTPLLAALDPGQALHSLLSKGRRLGIPDSAAFYSKRALHEPCHRGMGHVDDRRRVLALPCHPVPIGFARSSRLPGAQAEAATCRSTDVETDSEAAAEHRQEDRPLPARCTVPRTTVSPQFLLRQRRDLEGHASREKYLVSFNPRGTIRRVN